MATSACSHLLELAVVRVVEQHGRCYIRIVVHTNSVTIVDTLERKYGGVHRRHSQYSIRWEANSNNDLFAVANALALHTPELSNYLISYYGAGRGSESWEVARRLRDWLGAPSRPIHYLVKRESEQ